MNAFDQFDSQEQGNPFDQFDKKPAKTEIQRQPNAAATENPEDSRSFLRKTRDFFTGVDRATDQTRQLPELLSSGILEGADISALKKAALTSAALLTLDPEELADIISSNVPEIAKVQNKDGMGNVFPLLVNQNTGRVAVVNKPGLSEIDMAQIVGTSALFGRGGAAKNTLIPALLKSGGKASVVQSGIEGGQEFGGGAFNVGDVALAFGGGAAADGVAHAFGSAWPAVKSAINSGKITPQIRQKFLDQADSLGIPEEYVTDDVIRKYASGLDNITGPESEFSVNLTRGQRSGSQALLREEDMIRSGVRGDAAQDAYLKKEVQQLEGFNQAASNMQKKIAGESPVITNTRQAGAALREGVQDAERLADDAIYSAYDQIGDASLKPDGFMDLVKATKDATRGLDFPKDKEIVPAYTALMKRINDTDELLQKNGAAKLAPVHIKALEAMRRSIGAYADAAKNKTDLRNINAIKGAFDDYLDYAVIRSMFDGDDQALKALKSARGTARDYYKKFGRNTRSSRIGRGGDAPGQFIKKIILENPTDEQVVNSLFSASGFDRGAGAKMAKRYKDIVGADSNEWNMIRQAAFNKIVAKKRIGGKEYVDGAKTLSNFNKAKDGSLIGELFSKPEIAEIGRFAAVAKKTSPDIVKSRTNPSQSGLVKSIMGTARLASLFTNNGGYYLADGARIMFKNTRASNQAKNAFKPFAKVRASYLPPGSGVYTSQQAGDEELED